MACYRDELALEDNGNMIDFPNINNNSFSFKFEQQITRQAGNIEICWNNDSIKISK